MKFGLTDQEFQILFELVISPLKASGATVWIFGSRARGDHKAFSDIDIMYETKEDNPLLVGFISVLKESIEESRLPYKVDIVDFKDLAESYRTSALADRIQI
jgi:predicted nucleotidyltransferase